MVSFEILNGEDQQHIRVEDHIETLLSRYTRALAGIKSSPAKTKEEFEDIMKSKYFKEELDKISDIHDSSIHVLKFCVYKNYAALMEGKDQLKYFEHAIEVDPSDLKLLLMVSDLRMKFGDYQECLDRLLQALELQLLPDERILIMVKIQKLMYDYGCFREALEWGNLVLKLDPNEKTALGIKAEIIRDHLDGGSNGEFVPHIKVELVDEYTDMEVEEAMEPESDFPIPDDLQPELFKQSPRDIDVNEQTDLDTDIENTQQSTVHNIENIEEIINDLDNMISTQDVEMHNDNSGQSNVDEHQNRESVEDVTTQDTGKAASPKVEIFDNAEMEDERETEDAKEGETGDAKEGETGDAKEGETGDVKEEESKDKEEGSPLNEEDNSDDSDSTQKKRKAKRKRVSERVKRQHTVEEEAEEVHLEEITTLNQNLPAHQQFTEDGIAIVGTIDDYKEFNDNISTELLAKQITRQKVKRKVHAVNYTFWDQFEDHEFFTSIEKCQEFVSRLDSYEHYTVSMVACQLVVTLIKNDIENNQSSSKMYAILSVLIHSCSRTTSLFDFIIGDFKNCPFFSSIQDQVSIVLFTAEILFDSILDSSKKEFYEDCDEEIGGNGSVNPLIRCSRFDLFNRAMNKIRLTVESADIEPKYVLRYYWLIAKREEVLGTPYTVVKSLEDCFDFYNLHYPTSEAITVLASTTENRIDSDSIAFKIQYQQLRLHIDETQSLVNDMKLEQVVERLESLLLNMRSDQDIPGKDIINQMPPLKRLDLMEMLKLSCQSLGLEKSAFQSIQEGCYLLISYLQEKSLDIYSVLEKFSNLIFEFINIVQKDRTWKQKYLETPLEDAEFSFIAFASIRISWSIVECFRNIPVSPKNTFQKRVSILKNYCANSWVLFAHYLAPNEDNRELDDKLSEILIWAHDQLGKFGLCGGSDGIFLKYNVNHISNYGASYDHEIYQCYACLYGTELKANPNQYLWDHKCKHSEFDEAGAKTLFKFLKPILLEKMSTFNFRMLPKDLRFCMDLICKIYPEPPLEQVVCFDLFYIQGKVLLNGYYNKQEKDSSAGLNTAIEKFIQHLALKPFDMDAWISLATCYTALAYEILSANITSYTDRLKVADYQKCAFHCFVRATKLERMERPKMSKYDLEQNGSILWSNFALLCQSIISGPMNAMAIKNESATKKIWETKIKDSTDQDIHVPEFTENTTEKSIKYLYGTMAFCFKKATNYNSEEWSYYYRLAHVYRKLEKEPDAVIECYVKVLSIMPAESTSKEQDPLLDPIYKCTSYLLKCKQNRTLRDIHISDTIDKLCSHHPLLGEAMKTISGTGVSHLAAQPLSICKLVYILEAIKKVDKRRWYHKPYYRLANIYLNVLKRPDLAKEEMCSLLNIKSKAGLRKLWKTEFELPGRFYIYYHQYIKFVIEVATLTNDVNILWNLCKKLKTEDTIMLQQNLLLEARKSILAALNSYTKTSDSDFKEMSVKSIIDPETEKRIQITTKPKTDFHSLVLACELKRSRKSVEPALEKFILNLYCKLYLEASKTEISEPAVKPKKSSSKDLSKNIMARALAVTKNVKEQPDE
ncbi:Histone transcription regulator 3 [Terramyces sp. JEL0728]|nr:Histone transcription regulator 3 [Terramyces sp. JEL0728]